MLTSDNQLARGIQFNNVRELGAVGSEAPYEPGSFRGVLGWRSNKWSNWRDHACNITNKVGSTIGTVHK